MIFSHDRRRPIHLAVTANPTAEWTSRQLLEAFPWDSALRYLLRDRDACYGKKFHDVGNLRSLTGEVTSIVDAAGPFVFCNLRVLANRPCAIRNIIRKV